MSNLEKPIIFLGFPRSGTTIISEIIMQHHKLAWISNYQAKFPKNPSINLLRNVFQNQFWDIRGQKNQLNEVPLLNKYVFRPDESYNFWDYITKRDFAKSFLLKKEENAETKNEIRAFINKLVRFQNRERLAFKITGPSRLCYLHSIFPDACFIRIKRKPLPTLRSLLRVGFWNRKGGKEKLWWNEEGLYDEKEIQFVKGTKKNAPALLAALQYYKVDEVYETEVELCDANSYEVCYENFIEEPDDELEKILKFVDLEYDYGIKNYLEENDIYNRNKKEDFYIGPEIDEQIKKIAENGIENCQLRNYSQ